MKLFPHTHTQTEKHKNIKTSKTSKHQNTKTSKHQSTKTSKHKNIKTSKHVSITFTCWCEPPCKTPFAYIRWDCGVWFQLLPRLRFGCCVLASEIRLLLFRLLRFDCCFSAFASTFPILAVPLYSHLPQTTLSCFCLPLKCKRVTLFAMNKQKVNNTVSVAKLTRLTMVMGVDKWWRQIMDTIRDRTWHNLGNCVLLCAQKSIGLNSLMAETSIIAYHWERKRTKMGTKGVKSNKGRKVEQRV
ncbi:hypothetical protein POVWA2_025570 [Plasmodium ovale wallikeri]|uniref:Uncharacterized protein n=1 Tax=Plasmodium ovale wallikeri TaxID=864142 RepID=A0A1A8YUH8_PLAOA|nr:hypothetical protein POVWA1_025740 [Plasmodium ovale wallikeri]SBT35541.1 hypothetical protein POVWA2_025570 [Plasmodium ovale wallikeri]